MYCFILRLMTDTTVRVVAGILCLVLVAIIFLRRENKKKTDEDGF